MNTKTLLKAALYVRVSTDAQREEGYSIEAQKEALQGYCIARGWKSYEFYIDGGFSGSNLNRPAMQRLIRDAKAKHIQKCIVYKLDRLSRSQKDTLYLIEDVLNPHDVDFISINETLDTSTPLGRLMLGILSAFAQLERENIRERTRMGMLERIKEGYWMGGGRIPFGYDYDKEQGILVPNADAETVRQIYDLYIGGKSAQAIADLLGLKYDRLVMQILTRKSNLGIIVYNGKEYPGKHDAIIDRQTYEQAMLCMEQRTDTRHYHTTNLLTGLLRCGHCHARMHYQSWGNTGKKKISCYSQQTSKKYLIKDACCEQPKLWSDEVEKAVLEDVFRFTIAEHKRHSTDSSNDLLSQMIHQQSSVEQQLKRLYSLYATQENDLLLDSIQQLQQKYEKICQQIELEKEQQLFSQNRLKMLDKIHNLQEVWELLTFEEKRSILLMLIEEIIITNTTFEIHYHFT